MASQCRLRTDLRDFRLEFVRPGESELSGEDLWRVGQVVVAAVIIATNLVGAVTVTLLATLVLPLPIVASPGHVEVVDLLVAAAYVVGSVLIGIFVGVRELAGLRRWLLEERPATSAEQLIVLRAPLRLFIVQIALWMGAAILFGALDSTYNGGLGLRVGATVALTGVSTASCAYLLTERILRGVAARALAQGAPDRLAVPGVASRAVLAWALGTGVPLTGLVVIGAVKLAGGGATSSQLTTSIIVLGSVALTVGLLAISVAARATADPVDSVRDALDCVQLGQFDTRVPVYDGTQLGQLQMGFNRMVVGLAERERIRAAFETYVDPDVAEHILSEGTNLEGEEVDVSVMFVDIRDFTGFAENRAAREVVGCINELFEAIVPVIHAHGGHVDKFIGDGLLAVFGAPRRQVDHADQALAAALAIERAMRAEVLRVGIGINSGPVISGNVGGAGRFEFSVIGDVVNTAARVEEATRQTGDTILLAQPTKDRLQSSHPTLVMRPNVALKGRRQPVGLYAPQVGEDLRRSADGAVC
jgi:adenylate cyclase